MARHSRKEKHPIRNFFLILSPVLIPALGFYLAIQDSITDPIKGRHEMGYVFFSLFLVPILSLKIAYELSDKSNDLTIHK